MPRAKAFDPERVLERALDGFPGRFTGPGDGLTGFVGRSPRDFTCFFRNRTGYFAGFLGNRRRLF